VPTVLIEMMHDPARAEKAMGAVMQMDKIDIAKVKSAVEGK
jgi:predicted 3-demethylubiquinone-9 3-methyltransferase (glyoxalase superfamily)